MLCHFHLPARRRGIYLSMADPCVRSGLVDAGDSQAPDALVRQLLTERSSALETCPCCLHFLGRGALFERVPLSSTLNGEISRRMYGPLMGKSE